MMSKTAPTPTGRRARPALLAAEPAPGPGATLARVVEHLGAIVVDVLAAPRGLDVEVEHAVIHDPTESLPFEVGDLVLAVGVRMEERGAIDLVTRAGLAGAAAVAIKVRESATRLVEAAEECGVALLGVTPEIAWEQLHTVVRTAMASAGQVPADGAGGGPLGELFSLANAVSAMVGGPTTIEDPQSRVLAYSSLDEEIDEPRRQTILGRRVPEAWIKRLQTAGVFRELWSSQDVVRVDKFEEVRPRLAMAVRAGSEILGSIWVAEGATPLGKEAEQALREAAQIAALHLVRYRVGEDLERRIRGDLLRSVLEGRGPLKALADRLGLDPGGQFAVIGFEITVGDDLSLALKRERVLSLVSVYCEAYRRRAAQVAIGQTIYALLPLGGRDSLEGVMRLANDAARNAERSLSLQLRVGIGALVASLGDVPRSRAEVDLVLRVLSMDAKRRTVAHIDDVRAQALLLQLRDLADERPQLRIGRLATLLEHDRKHGTEYVATVRAYLESFGDVPTAAGAIGVHPNTFRYRVRRLSEIADIDLGDPDQRFAVELQLRLL